MAKRFEKAKEYNRKYKSILLPCRFCGNTDARIVSDRINFQKDGWCVCCSTHACDCTRSYTSVRKAIERWNEMQRGGLSA